MGKRLKTGFAVDTHILKELGVGGKNTDYYFRPGLTWPGRPHKRGAFSYVPPGVILAIVA